MLLALKLTLQAVAFRVEYRGTHAAFVPVEAQLSCEH